MKKFSPALALLPVLALAACGKEPAPAPAPSETVAAAPAGPDLPPPDQEIFQAVFAEACPEAKPVSESICKAALGSDDIFCEYGLGDDEYLRYKATLTPGESNWTVADPATVCAQGA